MIRANLEKIQADIERYTCYTDKDRVQLLPVTKTIDVDRIQEVLDCGYTAIGENKVQELLKKHDHFGDRAQYHLIGSLQTNKVRQVIDVASLIHSVDRIRLIKELEKRAVQKNMDVHILLQMNLAKEESKSGFFEEELPEALEAIAQTTQVKVKGLMTMAPYVEDPEEVRWVFRKLKSIFDQISREDHPNVTMEVLSMGMSGDYKIALEEGATLIRVGSLIFGERDYGR